MALYMGLYYVYSKLAKKVYTMYMYMYVYRKAT